MFVVCRFLFDGCLGVVGCLLFVGCACCCLGVVWFVVCGVVGMFVTVSRLSFVVCWLVVVC